MATDGEICIVEMLYGTINFHSIVVRPFYKEKIVRDSTDSLLTLANNVLYEG